VKINFDWASKGNLGSSKIRVVARSDDGRITYFCAKRIMDGTKNQVECLLAVLISPSYLSCHGTSSIAA